MSHWREVASEEQAAARPRAVAYYRHSAQDRQENSIPIQREQVREWAENNGVEIIEEFADAGKSGLTAEGRPAFTKMMDEWIRQRDDFQYVLCLDVSRRIRRRLYEAAKRHFGTRRRALGAAGIDVRHANLRSAPRPLDRDKIIAAIQERQRRAARPSSARWPSGASRRPRPWSTPTRWASSTATSSRRT
jgi:DNA invertase Pin-like site-specific DNA recombinase